MKPRSIRPGADLRSDDGRYYAVQQDDGNFVLYDTSTSPWTPMADKWSWELAHGANQPPPPNQPDPPPVVHHPDPPQPPGSWIAGLKLLQVTNADDGEFWNRFYSYWSNAWIAPSGLVHVFAGHRDGAPRFFAVNMDTGAVDRRGALLNYRGTGEGWGWTKNGLITLIDGPRYKRVNPNNGNEDVLIDISDRPGSDLWQAHSSRDGTVHSATVRLIRSDGPYAAVGTVFNYRGDQWIVPAIASLDESQCTDDGEFGVIKEGDFNRIIRLRDRYEYRISNEEGALGHSDVGDSIAIGEDDQRGACVVWDLVYRQKRVLFETWNMGHVSYQNGKLLLSNDDQIALVGMNGEGITPLIAHGMRGSRTARMVRRAYGPMMKRVGVKKKTIRTLDYDHQVFANLDATARVACYVSNHGSNRFDVFVLRLP